MDIYVYLLLPLDVWPVIRKIYNVLSIFSLDRLFLSLINKCVLIQGLGKGFETHKYIKWLTYIKCLALPMARP